MDASRQGRTEEFKRGEADVEAKSEVFRKELGLIDLTLTQILFVVGLQWVGVAAKQGPSHVGLWLLAMALFYLPSAAVVIHLNRLMPLEGGLYQWAKLGFSDMVGFLVAWNLWLFAILNTSGIGLQVSQYIGYLMGPEGQQLTQAKWFVGAVSVVMVGALVVITVVGLGVGKWVHKAGSVLMLLIFATLLLLPLLNRGLAPLTPYHPLDVGMPVLSLMTFNLFAKMGFGALGGFEYVAIHAGEARNPVRLISRSVALAAPIIALMFILGTGSVLALVPMDQIDLIAPIPQVMTAGFGRLGYAAVAVAIIVLAMLGIRIAQASVTFAGNTRLPMVAGWDSLLPKWFTTLHATYRTPVNSILFVGAVTLALGVVGLMGVGKQEAFQLLWNAAGLFYGLTYVVMFALPLFGLRDVHPRPPLWLKAASLSGLLMVLLYIGLSIVPIIQVESRLAFALKISGLILVTNAIGVAMFAAANRRRRNSVGSAA